MIDTLSPADREKTMRAVKSSGTSLERKIWAMLAGMGLTGWKKNCPNVPGKPDIVFLNEKVAIFIDGCFWHNCPICNRPLPKNNSEYWKEKIKKNQIRDKNINIVLKEQGWLVIRIWEHDINNKKNYHLIRDKITSVLHASKHGQ